MSSFNSCFFIVYSFPRRQVKWSGIPVSKNFPVCHVLLCALIYIVIPLDEFNEWLFLVSPVQFSSVQWLSCVWLMDCSMPGFRVHHQLPEFTQTHVHWVRDAIQPSHPLSSPFLPAFNFSQHQSTFQWVSSSYQAASASVLPVNIQGWFLLGFIGLISLQSKWLSRVLSSTTVQKY